VIADLASAFTVLALAAATFIFVEVVNR